MYVIEGVLGLINRFAQQLNVFSLSQSLKSVAAIWIIWVQLTSLVQLLQDDLIGRGGVAFRSLRAAARRLKRHPQGERCVRQERRWRQDREADTEAARRRAQEGRRRQEQGRHQHAGPGAVDRAGGDDDRLCRSSPGCADGQPAHHHRPGLDGHRLRGCRARDRCAGRRAVADAGGDAAGAGGRGRPADRLPAGRPGAHLREGQAQARQHEPGRGRQAHVLDGQPDRADQVDRQGGADVPARLAADPLGDAADRAAWRARPTCRWRPSARWCGA